MDDKDLSYKNQAVISIIINDVNKHLGDVYFVRGNKHNLLGMNIEIKYNIIQVYMVKQLEEWITMFGEYVST